MSACAHCGAPTGASEAPAFCCAGCRTVHETLRGAGLSQYYALRDRAGAQGRAPPSASAQPFDDPAFLAEFAPSGDAARLHLDGVHCVACVWVVEQLPRLVPGVRSARLDFGRQQVRLRWDPTRVGLGQIARALGRLGYPASPVGQTGEAARRRASRRALIRLTVAGALAGNAMMIASALYAGADTDPAFRRVFEWIALALAVPAVTWCAAPFYRSAWAGLRARTASIDLPVVIGLGVGFVASVYATIRGHGPVYFDSVNALVFLLLLGRAAQRRGQHAAMSRAELVAALTPGRARRVRDGRVERVASTALSVGDEVRVRPGEAVPADGRLLSPEAHVGQSLLTGEARPARLEQGAAVFAGTVDAGAGFALRVEAVGPDTRIARLMGSVAAEDQERAPLMRAADRLATRLVVAVLVLAAASGLAWWSIDPARVFPVVIALLVVTCPCALGLATPIALAVARGRAARAGIIFRSTAAIERLAGVRRVCFDKTGTLTQGRHAVVETVGLDGALRPLVGAVAAESTHPVARALAHAWPGGPAVGSVTEIPGTGLRALVQGTTVEIGAPGRLDPTAYAADRARVAQAGSSPVLVRIDGRAVGLIAVGDPLRPGAADALRALEARGISVSMLSGDDPRTVRAIAEVLGLVGWRGGVSPEDKAEQVATTPTLMVGDGLNDGPALRAASVGLAVRGGAEVVLHIADGHLADGDPALVVAAVDGARRTLRVVRRNLGFSLAYNAVFASLAVAGQISPLAAAVLMPISSLTVIGHSVLAATFSAPPRPGAPRRAFDRAIDATATHAP